MSNPRQCDHSMVADLCGMCIRDNQIKQLTQQHDELLAALKSARDLLDGADGLSWNNLLNLAAEEVESIDKAIAKAGAQ